MASAAELMAENERMAREIHALLSANTTLQKEVLALGSERDELEASGSRKVQSLAQELESVDEELASLRSQCQSMTEILERADAENEVDEKDEPVPVPVSRRLSTAFNQTVQRARTMSMPRQRRSSTVDRVAHGLTKAASYIIPPSDRHSPDGPRRPRMSKDSPPILSYGKGSTDATKSLLFSTHSHYGNFRRHSGPYRKTREPASDPVVVI
ncbi:Golgin subfamily A member 4-like [Phytophthora cinnamomi]|uniref:Golgin subfamily A member 4-like n=1 Tax=Phytophthora cinnamomi TaxID=4785 RepID=UPI00355983EB|nr:Golgin subfamily A member 4-like [Phytophthora cinnamomi]